MAEAGRRNKESAGKGQRLEDGPTSMTELIGIYINKGSTVNSRWISSECGIKEMTPPFGSETCGYGERHV